MYLKRYFGSMRLDGISSFTIEKYKKARLDQGSIGDDQSRARYPIAPVQPGGRVEMARSRPGSAKEAR